MVSGKLYPFKINSKIHGCQIKNKTSLIPFSWHPGGPGREITPCVAKNKASLLLMKIVFISPVECLRFQVVVFLYCVNFNILQPLQTVTVIGQTEKN